MVKKGPYFSFCLILFCAHLFCHGLGQNVVTSVSGNALSLLNNAHKISITTPLPPDITFFFADIKFTGREFKICEFGEMYLSGADTRLIINGKKELLQAPYWDLFWHYAKQFNKPLWYVGRQKASISKELIQNGGKSFTTLQEFLDYYHTVQDREIGQETPTKIADFHGILVFDKNINFSERKYFLQQHPEILVVNAHTKRFTGKHHLFNFFQEHADLSALMPPWRVYKKEYLPTLATHIYQDIPAEFYIIKPMKGICSKGVMMVHRENLDALLNLILQDKEAIQADDHHSLVYWKTDNHDIFFVQAYAPSKKIMIGQKQYDPTMHVIFFLSHDQGVVTVNVVAGHWKIPQKACNEPGLLTEQHITLPDLNGFALENFVNPLELSKDLNQVRRLMNKVLPSIYVKMLEHKNAKG